MFLGQCLGPEKIDSEYKEFCLKYLPYDYFSEIEILDILQGNWHPRLNQLIIQNISIYLKIYLAKCISAFYNSKIKGQLIFGCNDYGEICGIPYYCENENNVIKFKNQIERQIQNEFSSNLSLKINPKIIIQELEVNNDILDDEIKPLLKVYLAKSKEYNMKYKNYTRRKKKWLDVVLKYSAKLHILLNTPGIRKEFIDFISEKNGDKNIINFLQNTGYISPPSGDDMKHAREKKTQNLAYWLALFKDTKLDIVMLQKPKRPKVQIPQNPFMIIHRLSLLRKRFSHQNKIKYFIIKIHIDNSKNKDFDTANKDHLLQYKDTFKGWVSNIRLVEERGPFNRLV